MVRIGAVMGNLELHHIGARAVKEVWAELQMLTEPMVAMLILMVLAVVAAVVVAIQ